jgi:uncharacterized protein (TIGR02246 family)
MTEPTTEDRIEIRELYDRMFWAWNTGDAAGVEACFTPDGRIVHFDGSVSTAAECGAVGRSWQEDPVGVTRQHHVTNVIVDAGEHADELAVRMYFFVTEVTEPPAISIRWSAWTRGEVERIDGRWRIHECRVELNQRETA